MNNFPDSSFSDLETRLGEARELWAQGREAEHRGDFAAAYALFTAGHDRVIDCAVMHREAHVHLRRVNWRLGHYGELLTDWALALFAPLGVFTLVSYFSRKPGWFHEACRHG